MNLFREDLSEKSNRFGIVEYRNPFIYVIVIEFHFLLGLHGTASEISRSFGTFGHRSNARDHSIQCNILEEVSLLSPNILFLNGPLDKIYLPIFANLSFVSLLI